MNGYEFSKGLHDGKICLVYNVTIHTILYNKKYLMSLTLIKAKVNIISSLANLIEGLRITMFIIVNDTELFIHDALYSPNLEEIF